MKSFSAIFLTIKNSQYFKIFVMAYFFFVVFCPPFAKSLIPFIFLDMIRIVGFLLIIMTYLYRTIIKKQISVLVLSAIFLSSYLFIISYLNACVFVHYAYQIINLLCAVFITDIFSDESDKTLFCKVILVILTIYFIAQIIISIVDFVFDTSYGYFIYANRNVMFVYLMPIFLLFDYFINSEYKKFYLIIILSAIIFNLVNTCFTSTVVLTCFTIYAIYLNKCKKIYRFQYSYLLFLVLILLFFFSFVYFGTNSIVLKAINDLPKFLSKVQSIFDRAEIYNIAKSYFNSNPIFGIGYRYYYDFIITHNTIYDILIWGGVVALVLYFVNLFVVINTHKKDIKYQSYVIFAILMIELRDMFESPSLYYVFFNFGLLYYYKLNNNTFIYFKK